MLYTSFVGTFIVREMLNFVTTLTVLYRLKQFYVGSKDIGDKSTLLDIASWVPLFTSFKKLVSYSQWQVDNVTRAVEFCLQLTKKHAMLCSVLELGNNWPQAIEKLITATVKPCSLAVEQAFSHYVLFQ